MLSETICSCPYVLDKLWLRAGSVQEAARADKKRGSCSRRSRYTFIQIPCFVGVFNNENVQIPLSFGVFNSENTANRISENAKSKRQQMVRSGFNHVHSFSLISRPCHFRCTSSCVTGWVRNCGRIEKVIITIY